jgi:hypothetical protein
MMNRGGRSGSGAAEPGSGNGGQRGGEERDRRHGGEEKCHLAWH